jgi:predicted hotdog family 3-hydroxylacyl-ACP dehydratase
MKPCPYPVAAIVPHAAPMILLDEVLDYDETTMRAAVTIRESTMFRDGASVPAYVGLEYMAQTCGAHVGALARDAGTPVRVGFLLGTRQYKIHVPRFQLGEHLIVAVHLIYRDDEMGSFDCRIDLGDRCAAEARLNVYQPRNERNLQTMMNHE